MTGTEQDAFVAEAFKTIGTVSSNTTGLNVRSGPSVNTDVITLISSGTQVVIIGEEGDFYQVQLDTSCTGYVHKDYIDVVKTAAHAISLDEERVQVEEDYESQAAESSEEQTEAEPETVPETAAPAVEQPQETVPEALPAETAPAETVPETTPAETVPEETAAETTPAPVVAVGVQASYIGGTKYAGNTVSGAEISVQGVFSDGSVYPVDGWACAQVGVALAEGTNTFVVSYAGFETSFSVEATVQQTTVATDANADLRAALVNYGMQFVGNPYVYGGTDLINGTDCSGFTMRIYEHFGIGITRTSRSQAVAGREISLSDVQVGDLVFYTNLQTGEIGHVAMYIGNGQIVHAASETLGIIVSDMYYRQPCKAVTFLN
jgi:cell wall-associated NlpC family hydrolase